MRVLKHLRIAQGIGCPSSRSCSLDLIELLPKVSHAIVFWALSDRTAPTMHLHPGPRRLHRPLRLVSTCTFLVIFLGPHGYRSPQRSL